MLLHISRRRPNLPSHRSQPLNPTHSRRLLLHPHHHARPHRSTTTLTTPPAPPASPAPPPAPQTPTAYLTSLLLITTTTLLATHIVWTHALQLRYPLGPSMLPTLPVRGSAVLVSAWHRRGRGVRVGDVVTFVHPMMRGERAIKRVVGMPGDLVLRDTPRAEAGEAVMMVRVPEGHCWVAGDNVSASRDSRMFGPLPLALVRGKVVARVLPWPPRWFGDELRSRREDDDREEEEE